MTELRMVFSVAMTVVGSRRMCLCSSSYVPFLLPPAFHPFRSLVEWQDRSWPAPARRRVEHANGAASEVTAKA